MTTIPVPARTHEPLLDRISRAVLEPPRRSPLRYPFAAATAGAAAEHIPVTGPHLQEAPDTGVLFLLLTATLALLTVFTLLYDSKAVYWNRHHNLHP